MEKELLDKINEDLKKLKEKQKKLQAESKTGSNLDEIQAKLDDLAKVSSKIQSRTNDKKKVEEVIKLAKDGKSTSKVDISDLYRKYKVDTKSVSKEESTEKAATKENQNKSTKDKKAAAAPKKAAESSVKTEAKKADPIAVAVKKPAGRNRGRGANITKAPERKAKETVKEPAKELKVMEIRSEGRKAPVVPTPKAKATTEPTIVTLDKENWKSTKKEKAEHEALVNQVLNNLEDAGFTVEGKKEETPVIPKEIKVDVKKAEPKKEEKSDKVLVAGGKLTKGQRPEFTEYEVDTSGWKFTVGKDINFEFKNGREGYKTDRKTFKEGFEMEQAEIAAIIVEYCNYTNAELAHKLANKACNKAIIYAISKLPITPGRKKDIINGYLRDLDNPAEKPFVVYDLTEISRAGTHGPDSMRSDQKYALAEIAEIAHQRGNAELIGRFKVGAIERVVNFFKGGRARNKIASADILMARLQEDQAARRKKKSDYPDFASIKIDPEKLKRGLPEEKESDSRLDITPRETVAKSKGAKKVVVPEKVEKPKIAITTEDGVQWITQEEFNKRTKATVDKLVGPFVEESRRRKEEAEKAKKEELAMAKKAWEDAEKEAKKAKEKVNSKKDSKAKTTEK